MPPTLASLGIDQLSVKDRLSLVQQTWDSIGTEATQLPLTPAQRAELERRADDNDANPDDDTLSWEQVRDEATAPWQK